jgi:hypothetical protein
MRNFEEARQNLSDTIAELHNNSARAINAVVRLVCDLAIFGLTLVAAGIFALHDQFLDQPAIERDPQATTGQRQDYRRKSAAA